MYLEHLGLTVSMFDSEVLTERTISGVVSFGHKSDAFFVSVPPTQKTATARTPRHGLWSAWR